MKQSEIVNPIGVELDETARRMAIRWDDGHLGYWSWESLRRACPCALCAGEGNMPGVVTLETYFTPQQTTLERVKWIGRYALAPIWAARLGRADFTAFQASARGGRIACRIEADRVWLGGGCVTVVEGTFFL